MTESVPPPRAGRATAAIAIAACVLGLAQSLAGAYQSDTTFDEPIHLEWARRLVFDAETERASDTHFDSKTPLTVANVAARRLARRHTRDPEELRFASRLPSIAWLALLYAAVFLGARRYGGAAACAAVVLVAADPNLSAHAGIVTVDVGYALASLVALLAAWRHRERFTASSATLAGLALAFAFTAKFSAVLLLPFVAAAFLAPVRPAALSRRSPARPLLLVALGSLAFCLAVGVSYRFEGMLTPLRSREWRSAAFSALARSAGGLALPLPVDLLSGIDVSLGKEREKEIPVQILGHQGPGPVPYYFAVAWLLKTPLALILAQLLGLAWCWRARAAPGSGLLAWLAASLALDLAYLSLVFRYQIGYRYALMCLPLVAILAGVGLARRLGRGRLAALLGLVVLGSGLEQLPYAGNAIAFSNALVQPKASAYRLLGFDSNLDYGQNRARGARWLAQRGGALHVEPLHPLPGENAFPLVELGHARHAWWRVRAAPHAHFRHTTLLFHIDEPFFAAYLDAARRLSAAPPSDPCAAVEPGEPWEASELVFPAGDSTLCLAADALTEVRIGVVRGLGYVGPASSPRRLWDGLEADRVAHWRLDPGAHRLGAMRASGLVLGIRASRPLRVLQLPGWDAPPAPRTDREAVGP